MVASNIDTAQQGHKRCHSQSPSWTRRLPHDHRTAHGGTRKLHCAARVGIGEAEVMQALHPACRNAAQADASRRSAFQSPRSTHSFFTRALPTPRATAPASRNALAFSNVIPPVG